MSKKNIDHLFQEKFKDFDESPNEKVWSDLEASLDKKKKSRRIIPLWWKLGGVAALLAILFMVINPLEDTAETDVKISDIEDAEVPSMEANKNEDLLNIPANDKVVSSDKKNQYPETINDEKPSDLESANIADINKLVKAPKSEGKKNITKSLDEALKNKANGITVSEHKKKTDKDALQITENKGEDAMPDNKDQGIAVVPNTQKNRDDITLKKEGLNKITAEKSNPENGIAQNEHNTENNNAKKSIYDEIEKEQENKEVSDYPSGKWSVGPSVAPVYFSSIGEGSPIHSNFTSNSKSGDVNFSYGVSVSYNVNSKLSLRTGVHRVDYGYSTNDIAFSSSFEASTNNLIDNINYALRSRNLVVRSKANSSPNAEAVLDFAAENPSLDGRMVQQFGYLEVPLELNYALIDSKFGLSIIGGVSSLFLADNSVTLESGDLVMEMGEANNINSVNFSTNFGFGLNYKFTPKVQLNLEPVFKYQLNTFSETSGSFQPFSIGIYSGLNFKF